MSFAAFAEFIPVAKEAGAVQVDVGEVERHRAALGDLLGLVQRRAGRCGIAADELVQRGGEQAFGKVIHRARVAETVNGGGDVRQVERRLRQRVRQNAPAPARPGPASGDRGRCRGAFRRGLQCFEAILARLVRLQRVSGQCRLGHAGRHGLGRPCHGGRFATRHVRRGPAASRSTGSLAASRAVELRLTFLLHPFGFGEERAGLGALAGLMQGVRGCGAIAIR